MTEAAWTQLVKDLPTAGLLALAGYIVLRYLDKWIDRLGSTRAVEAELRQKEILTVLERLIASTAGVQQQLINVVERNTKVLDTTVTTLVTTAEGLARLSQAETDRAGRESMVETQIVALVKELASRPCLMAKREGQ